MPGLIPSLSTPPFPQPSQPISSASSRPANRAISAHRAAARGSSIRAPIEIDSDPYHRARDDLLSTLEHGNFSPSAYPQSTHASSRNRQIHRSRLQSCPDHHPPGTSLSSIRIQTHADQNNLPQNRSIGIAAACPRRPTLHSNLAGDQAKESLFVSSDSEFEGVMPVQTRRRASTIPDSDPELDDTGQNTRKRAATSRGAAVTKRRRTSQTTGNTVTQATSRQETVPKPEHDEEDVFGEKDDVKGKKGDTNEDEVIDLAAFNEVPQEMLVPKEDKRIKLSAFQCVICMDDVTALTVTHCGHLFCSECLHSALNVDATKNKCPICRQKVETKDRGDYTTKTKGFWPLELKLMTATRKGKQRA